MNTASSTLNLNYNVRLAGAGAVQARKAVNSSTLAQTTDGLNALAFGFVAGTGDYTDHKSFTLTNTGAASVTYNLAVTGTGNQFGSSTTLDQSSVTIPAGQSETVTATFSMSAAAFAALPSDDTFAIGPGGVLSIRGVVVATPAGGSAADQQVLSVPYVAVPRGLSNVVAGTPAAFTKQADKTSGKFTSALPLSNTGIHAGTADLYSWGITDPQESGGAWDIRDVGVQVQPGEAFGSTADDRGLVFLVNTWGAASNHSIVEYDVNVDTNGDGTTDYFVVGVDGGAVLAGAFDGRLLSFTINASTGALVDAFIADAPMNGSTVELPALASDLGLSQKPLKGQTGGPRTGFAYGVAAFSELGPQVDTTGFAPFDVFQPSLSSGDSTNVAAGGTASLPLGVDSSQLNRNPALGWLVASVDDASGAAQAGEVPLPSLK
jgi:hypothetical protein